VLFINGDAEYGEKRAQNYLRPEDIEKIVTTFDEFRSVPGYATVVTKKELAENDWNLNIRRYADNTPLPEPQDVRAHLYGGIPKAEVAAKAELLSAHGLPIDAISADRDTAYYDFVPTLKERREIKTLLMENIQMQAQEEQLRAAFAYWWQNHQHYLHNLPSTQALMLLRADFLATFDETLIPIGLLDRYKIAGVIASWWNESQYDLRTISNLAFPGLIDSWINTVHSALEEPKERKQEKAKKEKKGLSNGERIDFILSHKLITRLLPEYVQQIAETKDTIADLEQQKEAFERGELSEQTGDNENDALLEDELTEDEASEGHTRNYASELLTQLFRLTEQISKQEESIKELKQKLKGSQKGKSHMQAQTLFADIVTP